MNQMVYFHPIYLLQVSGVLQFGHTAGLFTSVILHAGHFGLAKNPAMPKIMAPTTNAANKPSLFPTVVCGFTCLYIYAIAPKRTLLLLKLRDDHYSAICTWCIFIKFVCGNISAKVRLNTPTRGVALSHGHRFLRHSIHTSHSPLSSVAPSESCPYYSWDHK